MPVAFHAVGPWRPGQVHTTWVASGRRIVAEVEAGIEVAWAAARSRPGVRLFDGPMCRMERFVAGDDAVAMVMSPTSYRVFVGTNLAHPEYAEQYGPEVMAMAVGVSPSLRTADGWLLFGRRSADVAYYPARVHPFAGALEPRDAGDVFAGMLRELAEEVGVGPGDVQSAVLSGIAQDPALVQPELIFHVECGLTRAAVEARLDATEHTGTWAVRDDANLLAAAIRDGGAAAGLTPVGLAAVLLYGRLAHGDGWFAAARA